MLSILDKIQEKYNEQNNNHMYKNIKNIKFKFVDTNEENLVDDTYIKLNARGIPLSLFEEYKISFLEIKDDTKLKEKMDNSWKDWIWKKIDHNDYLENNLIFDNAFIRLFRAILNNQYALYCHFTKDTKFENNLLKNFLDDNDLDNDNIIHFYEYRNILEEHIQETINNIEIIMDFIIENEDLLKRCNQYIDINKYIDNMIYVKNASNLFIPMASNSDRIKFFAICLYIIQNYNKEFNINNYIQWTRIARNLIPRIIDDNIEYTNIIKKIKNIFDKFKDSNNYLKAFSNIELNEIENCKIDNLQGEIEKAKLMVLPNDNKKRWEEQIEKNDLNQSLKGDNSFLLNFSGCKLNETDNKIVFEINEDIAFEHYINYSKICNVIFNYNLQNDQKIINEKLDKNNVLARALLSYSELNNANKDCGYLLEMQNFSYTFLANDFSRDYSWINLAKATNKSQNKNKVEYLKSFMDDCIKNNAYDIDNILFTAEQKLKSVNPTNWKKYFIIDEYANDVFDLLNEYNLIKIYSNDNNKSVNIFLMRSKATSGNTMPLIFYALNKKLENYKIKFNDKDFENAWSLGIIYNKKNIINKINEKEVCIQVLNAVNIVSNTNDDEFYYYSNIDNLDKKEKKNVKNALNEIENEFSIEFKHTEIN